MNNDNHKVNISYLDLQDNDIQCINPSYFSFWDWSALNVLKLSNNRLGSGDHDACRNTDTSHTMDFLNTLWNLTQLYLDRNFMEDNLPPDMLLNQTRLQSLHLSQMSLTNVTLNMRHMKDLNVLDLSYNKIRCLDISTLRDINSIIHFTPPQSNVLRTFEINLSDNNLHCSCSCLEFYVWIRKVRHYITFIDIGSYQCTFDNGQRIYLRKLNLILDILHSQCVLVDWSPLTTATTAITTIYMFILLATTSLVAR